MDGQAEAPLSRADKHRARMAARSRQQTIDVSNIGDIPPPEDIDRRTRLEGDLPEWLRYYLHESFPLPFSADHLKIIHGIEEVAHKGGQQLNIVYRGFGKSTIVEGCALMVGITGLRRFILPIGAEKVSASTMLDSIKSEIEENPRLLADYPEVCFPVAALEGKAQRCASQHSNGTRTRMRWTGDHIVLPTVQGSRASGVIIRPCGITGAIRGARYKDSAGNQVRPDFVPIDDIQTDKFADSPATAKKLLGILRKTVFRLGGHQKTIACVINGTIIEPDDAMDQLTDGRRFPSLQVQKVPMIRKWADGHETLWLNRYADLRNSFIPDDAKDRQRAIRAANEFYAENHAEMDAGCEVSWDKCFSENELSAVQHAYNILIDDGKEVFQSECQNEPMRESGDLERLEAGWVANKLSGHVRGLVPLDAHKLTAFIDIQGKVLYYVVCAWKEDFTGYVLDYGAYPNQRKRWYKLSGIRNTLQKHHGKNTEVAIRAGLDILVEEMLSQSWQVDDGSELQIDRLLIDAMWGDTTDLVDNFCRQSEYSGRLMPYHGIPITATKTPIAEWKKGPGIRKGLEWSISRAKDRRVKSIKVNVNYWKKQVYEALLMPHAKPGSISLFQADPEDHRMIAEHCVSELPKKVEHSGRVVYEFKLKPGEDNHLWDCVVGCAVGASEQGITSKQHRRKKKKRQHMTLAEMAAQA